MPLSKREYEDFKSSINKIVNKYVSHDRSSIISLIAHSVDGGADKRKLEDKLMTYVDKSTAYKVVDKTFAVLDTIQVKSKSSKKRSHRDGDSEKDSKRAKVKENSAKSDKTENDVPNIVSELKEKIEPATSESNPNQAQQIKDLMVKAQATIEERKRVLAMQSLSFTNGASVAAAEAALAAPSPLLVSSTGALRPVTGDVASRIAQLQARIQAQLGNNSSAPGQGPPPRPSSVLSAPPPPALLSTLAPPGIVAGNLSLGSGVVVNAASGVKTSCADGEEEDQSKPTPLILDDEGRTIDPTGKEVQLTLRVPTLKANIRAKKREEFKQQLLEKPLEEAGENKFFDYRVLARPFLRAKKAFKFHEQGKYIQLAQRERAKSRLEKLQEQISFVAKRTGISSAAKLAQLEQRDEGPAPSPLIEWWDAIILQNERYPAEGETVKLKEDFITSLVEHPMEMGNATDLNKPVELQVFLTKKERKKLRRMNRRETWKEKQEKIRLGLEPPPEPKVRMANLMRVLGTEAVLDPTRMERHVRAQMAKRLKAHNDANAARKLTPEQRRQKRHAKLEEDTTNGVNVCVYRVTDMSNSAHKYKVETNARQLHLTGTVVLFKDVNVIAVEGGPKQQKKYKRLMMERIKWTEESRSKDASIEPKCQLVWEGVVQDRNFQEVQFKACPSESFAREHFKKHGVEQYWDLAFGKKVLEEAEDTF